MNNNIELGTTSPSPRGKQPKKPKREKHENELNLHKYIYEIHSTLIFCKLVAVVNEYLSTCEFRWQNWGEQQKSRGK